MPKQSACPLARFIAYRLSTIRTADRILVIEKGRILVSGTYQEFLANKGHFHAL